jgi:hypothetical protein
LGETVEHGAQRFVVGSTPMGDGAEHSDKAEIL